MIHFGRILHNHLIITPLNSPQFSILCRKLSFVASVYDGEKDPAPKFFSSDVQHLLKRLTRPDFDKVFRKRTNRDHHVLRTPRYKFLTDEELKMEITRAQKKADNLLQMPPVVKVHKPINDVISRDPALTGYDTAKYIFTDITFGVPNEHRIIVERDTDGTLQGCAHDIRKRMNQIYYPISGRKVREPIMFTDEERLYSLLDSQKYEFILDRACIQYEPDEYSYQRVNSITYQHVDYNRNYDLLRSTRHFGPFAFYLTWYRSADGLLLELLQTNMIRDALCLISLRHALLSDVKDGDQIQPIVQEILSTPIQLTKLESLTEDDIQLDSKCMEHVEKYVDGHSTMKSQQELALQGFRETYQQLVELSRGLKKAHGTI